MSTPIDISEQAGVRYLHFGSTWVQGAMRIARPWNLELEYTREMMTSLLLHEGPRWPRKILLIGLGAASLTKFLYRHRPDAHLTIVEIEPGVVAAARHFFKLPDDDKRIHMVIGDGVEFMMNTDKKFDLILVDGFNEHAHPGGLNTLPFYQACRSHLSDKGVLGVNLLGLCRGVLGGFEYILKAFDDRGLMLPVCPSGNTIVFGAEGDEIRISMAEFTERVANLKEETGLDLRPTLARLVAAKTCLNDTILM